MIASSTAVAQTRILSPEEMKADYAQLRKLLEEEHWDLYYHTPKETYDSIFDAGYSRLTDSLPINEFFKLLTPITAHTGNGHTNVWMPSSFWRSSKGNFFPYIIKIIDDKTIIAGSYNDSEKLPHGTVIHSINGRPINKITA